MTWFCFIIKNLKEPFCYVPDVDVSAKAESAQESVLEVPEIAPKAVETAVAEAPAPEEPALEKKEDERGEEENDVHVAQEVGEEEAEEKDEQDFEEQEDRPEMAKFQAMKRFFNFLLNME